MHKAKAEFDKQKFSYQNTKHKISYQKATLIYRITKHSNNKSPNRYLDIYKTEYRKAQIQNMIQPPDRNRNNYKTEVRQAQIQTMIQSESWHV